MLKNYLKTPSKTPPTIFLKVDEIDTYILFFSLKIKYTMLNRDFDLNITQTSFRVW